MRNLDIATLRSFVEVALQGGVTRAAQSLNLTQSAVSMQIKRLEELLDVALFERTPRQMRLTTDGEHLMSYARRILTLNDEAVARLQTRSGCEELVLGVPHDIIYPLVPEVLSRFASLMPEVQVRLISSYTSQLRDMLSRGEADLILTTETEVSHDGEVMTTVPLCWTRAQGGTAWQRQPLPVALGRNCGFRPLAIEALDAAGVSWHLSVDSDDDRPADALVSADLSVGVMLHSGLPGHLDVVPGEAGLPPLPPQQINLYGAATAHGVAAETMADQIRRAYKPRSPARSGIRCHDHFAG